MRLSGAQFDPSRGKPRMNYRPAFDQIMGFSNRTLESNLANSGAPPKLVDAMKNLLEVSKRKGVQDDALNLLRTYSSEIKNDITLLTIKRLAKMIETANHSDLPKLLGDCRETMRSNPSIADTVPALLTNMYTKFGPDYEKLDHNQLNRMVRKSRTRSKTTCPKDMTASMNLLIATGKFNDIPAITPHSSPIQNLTLPTVPATVQNPAKQPDYHAPEDVNSQDARLVLNKATEKFESNFVKHFTPKVQAVQEERREDPKPVEIRVENPKTSNPKVQNPNVQELKLQSITIQREVKAREFRAPEPEAKKVPLIPRHNGHANGQIARPPEKREVKQLNKDELKVIVRTALKMPDKKADQQPQPAMKPALQARKPDIPLDKQIARRPDPQKKMPSPIQENKPREEKKQIHHRARPTARQPAIQPKKEMKRPKSKVKKVLELVKEVRKRINDKKELLKKNELAKKKKAKLDKEKKLQEKKKEKLKKEKLAQKKEKQKKEKLKQEKAKTKEEKKLPLPKGKKSKKKKSKIAPELIGIFKSSRKKSYAIIQKPGTKRMTRK